MATPGREKLRRRVKNKKFAPSRRSSSSFSRLNSNGGGGSIVRAAAKGKKQTALRGGEKSNERKVPGRAAIGSRRFSPGSVGTWGWRQASIKANAS